MSPINNVGRIIGILLLAQIISGILVNFFLTAPLFGSPGFLVNGAIHSQQIGMSVLIGLITSGLTVAVAIMVFPVFREHSQAMAFWFIALSVVNLSMAAVENISVMSLVSFSEAYTMASAAERDLLETIRIVVSSARNWAHYISLILSGSTIFVLYIVLYRFALIPRPLAAFGLAAVVLQLTAVSMPLFGRDVVFLMLAPLGLSQIALALWLIAKGLYVNDHLISN